MTCIPKIFLFKSKDQKLLLQLLTKACVHNSLLCFFFFEQSKLGLWNKKLDVAVPEAVLLYRKIKNFLLSLVLFLQSSYFFVSPPHPPPPCPACLCLCLGIVILLVLLSLTCTSVIGLCLQHLTQTLTFKHVFTLDSFP